MSGIVNDFLADWSLFGKSFVAGWLIAVALAQLGCLVVARNQAFVGAAVAQASAGGVALAMWLSAQLHLGFFDPGHGGEHDEDHPAQTTAAIVAAVIASVAGLARGRGGDAATTWFFLVGSCLPVLLLSNMPHGAEEVNRLFGSSIIGVSRTDVWMFAAQAAVIAVAIALFRRRVSLVVLDPTFAAAVGLPVAWWSAGLAVALGVALGLSIASAGTIFSFGCLLLPALIARGWCATLGSLFIVAPIVALACSVVGFVLASSWNLPPGHAAVAAMAAVLLVGAGLRAAWGALRRAMPQGAAPPPASGGNAP